MQPHPLAIDVDPGFIDVQQRLVGHHGLDCLFERGQPFKGFAVEVRQRAGRQRQAELISKRFAHTLIRQQLALRQIDRVGLARGPVLYARPDLLGKRGDVALAGLVDPDLGAILGDFAM